MDPKKVLEAYAYSILAKDAAGKWSNPRRPLRSFEDIMEVASGSDTKSSIQETIAKAITEAIGTKEPVVTTAAKPKVDRTAKDFYNFRKDQYAVNNAIMEKLDALVPPK